jgi:hypothetical protein
MRDWNPSLTDHRVLVQTALTDDHKVIQTIDMAGELSRRVANVAAAQMETAFREQLMRLGWTPPADGRTSDGQ